MPVEGTNFKWMTAVTRSGIKCDAGENPLRETLEAKNTHTKNDVYFMKASEVRTKRGKESLGSKSFISIQPNNM